MPERYYRQLENIHVNCCEPRAYFIPFGSPEAASLEREKSPFFTLLSGEWDFAFFPDIEELEIEAKDFPNSVICEEKMPVPFCWQLKTDRGYDVPNYINQDYPYPVDPPHLPDKIPCGFYSRTVSFKKAPEKRYFVNFEGVAPCFYLWVNGEFAGYSQVSHCTSELDITSLLKNGENLFQVLVVKLCTGSYMEDQDFFRLSGIFRDVYILERENSFIKDVYIKNSVSEDLTEATLSVEPTLEGSGSVSWSFYSPEGTLISKGTSEGEFSVSLKQPKLWNPEAPTLYSLILNMGEEYIYFPVGLKRCEIKNSVFLLNGKKVKIRGINRHDTHPETGYWVSPEDMLEDLRSIRRANVNAIRTSHYPNDPRFLALCNKLGFMVIDEADLECHGMGYNYGDWYWDYWAYLCDAPQWAQACLDRAKRLFQRDKNNPCVIMWSLGNESGCGNSHRLMADYIRSCDADAIIHYENAHLEYAARLDKDFSSVSDVESRMYAPLDYLKNYLENDSLTKPFFYCEYVSAWTTGDIPLHWNGFEECDKYMGGCVWEYKDHSVNVGTAKEPRYRYGGDFGDKPNDGIYCVDGLVHPDRTPRPGYNDMKQTYKPFCAAYDNGVITVKNKLFFTSLSGVSAKWSLEVDGKEVKGELLENIEIPLGGELKIKAEFGNYSGNVTLNLSIFLAQDTYYAEKGYELGYEQFVLQKAAVCLPQATASAMEISETRKEIRVFCGDTEYAFSKITGSIISARHKGKEFFDAPSELNIYRAYLPNCANRDKWERARYNDAVSKCYSCAISSFDGKKAVITATHSIAAAAMPPAVKCETLYTVSGNGMLTVEIHALVTERAPALPRFGIKLSLVKGFENVEYLGEGERETYCDRHQTAKFSLYKTTADKTFEHYVRPTECAAHYGTLYARVQNREGDALAVADLTPRGFSFSARHFTDRQLMKTLHDDLLEPQEQLFLNIDYKVHGETVEHGDICPERLFEEKEFSMGFALILEK